MQSLCRFRKLVVLAALVWLPMSVFAQVCATQSLVAHMGGPQHPALVAPEEMSVAEAVHAASQPPLVVIDAATFWQSVDDFEPGCDMKSMCAFASLSALVSATTDLTFGRNTPIPLISEIAFSTRAFTPDTPPPRL
jgi:hypothetical protein